MCKVEGGTVDNLQAQVLRAWQVYLAAVDAGADAVIAGEALPWNAEEEDIEDALNKEEMTRRATLDAWLRWRALRDVQRGVR